MWQKYGASKTIYVMQSTKNESEVEKYDVCFFGIFY